MKTNNVLKSGIWFFLGMIISDIALHLRFSNDLLRRELILLMGQGNNGYFLAFTFIPIIGIIGLSTMLYYNSKQESQSEEGK